ncbi:iron-containing alcohol dehydrogenase [Thalassotalea sp. ND16A]|uniref:iron-containing alcohol dehydrogenase n=1 Tax=Thalassotalea sp. ND16A TaxID=1535422 RepID=UPI00051A28D6|nr:iron-containing alcohol dehydrogenase [Thalassotalea sp. ND16A]KGJ95679.1 Alcohol dehydrogenase [Thalassotalea sp. ND16A]
MQQFNFPTLVYFGEDALVELATTIKAKGYQKALLVSDKTLSALGVVASVKSIITQQGIEVIVFDHVHANPIEADVENGAAVFNDQDCDCILALGGGSAMDVAKVIKVAATHPGPLSQYDDAIGGDKRIINAMPPLYAIPTTAGTGSEVGRSGVIILGKSKLKTIIFSPKLMPDIAVLAPQLTTGLPPHITAATGIDAFTHSLEAFLAPGFHPMADGIALQGMRLCIENLDTCVNQGSQIKARGNMQVAAMMGATAFQKGLGMIHSLAHPLSAQHNMHHGLANALLLPESIKYIEQSPLNSEQKQRIESVRQLFTASNLAKNTLSQTCHQWFHSLGITFGLRNYHIDEQHLAALADDAFADPCHQSNIITVSKADLLTVYRRAL